MKFSGAYANSKATLGCGKYSILHLLFFTRRSYAMDKGTFETRTFSTFYNSKLTTIQCSANNCGSKHLSDSVFTIEKCPEFERTKTFLCISVRSKFGSKFCILHGVGYMIDKITKKKSPPSQKMLGQPTFIVPCS